MLTSGHHMCTYLTSISTHQICIGKPENQVLGRKPESISIEKDWLMDQDLEPRNSVSVDTEDLMRTASGRSERSAFWKKCGWQTAMREEVNLDQHFTTLEPKSSNWERTTALYMQKENRNKLFNDLKWKIVS